MAKKENTITISNDSALITCSYRYALGRQSYMPSMVVEELIPLLPLISDRNLTVMQNDLKQYLECVDRESDWNILYWNNLYDAVRKEQVSRIGELIIRI